MQPEDLPANGMSGVWETLFGKPQAWFDNIGRLQQELSVENAEINAYPSARWDQIYDQFEEIKRRTGAPPFLFTGYGWSRGQISSLLTSIVITKSHVPTDDQIAQADDWAKRFRFMLTFAKNTLGTVSPAARAEVDAEAARMAGTITGMTKMRSPSAETRETFPRELEKRAEELLGGGMTILKYVAAGVGVILGGFLLYKIL
jgi:hypothetical protein